VKRATAIALATLAIYALALTITPKPVQGVEQIVSDIAGQGSYVFQQIWALITFGATVGTIVGFIYRAWIEESRLMRALFSVSVIFGPIATAFPWLLVAFKPELAPIACVIRGWFGELLHAFC